MEKPFKDDNEQLDRLADANLDIPYRVLKKMEEIGPPEKGERKDKFISIIELFEGKFIERVFAFRFDLRKKGGARIKRKEVMRIIEGNTHKIFKDIYSTQFGHYVIWDEKKVGRGYYGYGYTVYPEDQWYHVNAFNMNLPSIKYYSFEECVQLDPSIQFCGYKTLEDSFYCILNDFIEYISWFRMMPEIEIYAKKDIMHLITDSRFYKRIKRDASFAKYFRESHPFIKRERYNYPQILRAFKSGEKIQIYHNRLRFYEASGYKGNESILTGKIVDKILEKYNDVHIYLDYFNAAKNFIYMDTNQALYPNNLVEAHDYYVSLMKKKELEIITEEFKSVVEAWKWLNWKNKQYAIILAPNANTIKTEGQYLHHCVHQMHYIKKMAEGGNLILFIRKIDEVTTPFFTIEFDKNTKTVVQCYGYKHSTPTKEINDFLNKWKKKLSYLRKKGGEASERSIINRPFNQRSNTEVYQLEPCIQ